MSRTIFDKIWESHRIASNAGGGDLILIDRILLHERTGGVALKNVDGSFHDFVGEHYRGTQREQLATYPDAWGGRAAVAWAQQLAENPTFDTAAVQLIELADALDAIYEAARCAS